MRVHIAAFFLSQTPPAAPSILPIVIATTACVIAAVNAAFSIYNVILTRWRMVKISWRYRTFGESIPGGNRLMVIEVQNLGAPIHNMETVLFIDGNKLKRAKGEPGLIPGDIHLDLTPLYTVSDPMPAGQYQEYDLSLRRFEPDGELDENHPMRNYDRRKAVKDALMQVGYRKVAIRVYCNRRTVLIKSVSSRKLKSTLDAMFQIRHTDDQ